MFVAGRRKTGLMRATARIGVGLMLSCLYRPAFATVPGGKAAALPATPADASQAAAAGPAPATAIAPSADRVRGAIVPVAVKLEKGAMGADPWTLFDGDGTVAFRTAQPLRVRVSLPPDVALETIGIYGGNGAIISASAEGASGPKPIAGLEKVALADLPSRWNRFSATAPVETSSLLLDITPALGQTAEVPELELWGRVAPASRPATSAEWAEALLTHLPAGAVTAPATPSTATIAAPQVGPAGHVPLTFDLDRAGRLFERAFLVYELEGLPHWSAVVRRINWQAPQGGFHAARAARHGLQVEEISPDWLREGRNELEFIVSDRNDVLGYKVKNARVVGVPASGNPLARARIETPRADKSASALVDGSRDTGLTNKDLRRAQAIDFRFAETSQPDSLMVAVDKGAKGTLTAQAIVRGQIDRGSAAAAELDQLGNGWARISLEGLPANADGVRVTLRGVRGESTGGLVSELRVTGSRLPTRRGSQMTVTYPLHGECVDGEAYIRGFLRGGADGIKGASLRIAGAKPPEALKWDGSFSAVVPAPAAALRSGGKWQVELESSFANGDATGAVVDVEGCKEPVVAKKNTGPVEDEGAPYGQVVRAGESAKLSFAGATLEIPAGALDDDTRITIRPISDIDIPATDESLTNVTAGGRAYRLGPHGLKFGKPIALTIPFDRGRFVGGQAEDDMGAYFFDQDAKRWRQVQTLKGDASSQMLTAATTHFTDFIAGTISAPDHPSPDSFNPNSIKDLKAADPTAGIQLIAPPEASPDGAAHLTFPIWVPPGRQGMQPSLNVTYNSSAGNGLMGIGWSLPVSSIAVDTRFGVGRYSQTEETETYEIDGDLLVPDPNQTPPRGTKTTYHRKAEGKFDAIYRIGDTGDGPTEKLTIDTGVAHAYHWEVVDKRGTRYVYGDTYGSRGSVLFRGVYRWYLSKVIDAFGNQILYTYDKRFPLPHVQSAVDTPTVEVLLKSIQYTADSSGQNAHYRLDFDYDAQATGDALITTGRPDVFTDARGGTLEVTDVRLARIQVFENPTTDPVHNVRRYDFSYIVGDFDKSLLYAIIVAQGRPPGDVDNPSGNVFYQHNFNYYNVVKNQATGRIAFDAPVAWSGANGSAGLSDGESDSVNGSATVGGSIAACDLAHAALGGSSSLDIPLPLPPIIADHNNNNDVAKRGLVDVNGDGLPDFVGSGGVRLNAGNSTFSANPRAFTAGDGALQPPKVHVADHSTVGFNGNVHFLYEAGHIGFGRVWGSSGDDALLSDVDGDGFIDYLTNDGNFTLNSHGMGFVSTAGWGQLPKTDYMSASAVADQKSKFELTEPTAVWIAPFPGFVKISGVAQKAPNLPSHPNADGVNLLIDAYHTTGTDVQNGQFVITSSKSLFHSEIAINDAAVHFVPGTDSLLVLRGDRIYFHVNAIDDIDDDATIWNPVITYISTTNEVGGSPVTPVTGEQLALPEPFSGAAYVFVQANGGDMRLAGEPVPTWHNDSAGPDPAKVLITSTPRNTHPGQQPGAGGWKDATSDRVKIEIFLAPNGDISAAQSITPSNFQTTYEADYVGPIPSPFLTQSGINVGDRIFFQVSSDSPIDAKQIDWKPHVEYINYCRRNTLSANSTDFTNQTTVCGGVINCASGTGCQIAGDPNAAANPIATTTIDQDIPVYFKLIPWQQAGVPIGFIPPGNGTVTLTGTFQSFVNARLVARGLERLAAEATGTGNFQGTQVNAPVMTFPVTQGSAILFDAFATNASLSQDPVRWAPHLHYDGPGGPIDKDIIFARRNYPASGDQGAGHVHGWQYFERNVDPSNPGFDDPGIQNFLTKGPGGADRNNPPANVKIPVGLMRQAPDGLPVPAPGVSVPGPIWAGPSVDGYIGEGVFKPSRTSRPISGSRVAFSSTSTESTDSGAALLFGTATDFSTSATNLALVDMNGDHYPDLVTPNGIQFNHPIASQSDPAVASGGQFDPARSINSPSAVQQQLGDLETVDGRQVSESLGISGPVRAGMRLSGKSASEVPGWVSLLPSVGVSYGHSQTMARLLDINGDGLPDYVRRDDSGRLIVRLNLGFRPDDRTGDSSHQGVQFTGDIQYAVATWSQTGSGVNAPSISNPGNALAVAPGGDFGSTFQSIANPANPGQSTNPFTGVRGARSDALRVQNSAGNNIGAGYSYFGGGLEYGLSRTTTDMIDVNGDGLPDMVKRDPGSSVMSVSYNRGDTFTEEQFWDVPGWPAAQQGVLQQIETAGFGPTDALAYSESHGQSESLGYAQYFEAEPFGCWGFEVGVGAGQSYTGSEMRFEDIDGDGAPDQVLKFDGDSNLYVRRNPARGTVTDSSPPNLLANVFNPLGGDFSITYARLGNVVDVAVPDQNGIPQRQVDMPNRQNVMVTVSVEGNQSGPLNQDPGMVTYFDYGVTPSADVTRPTSRPSGYFDRVNREFLGFSHITTTRLGDGQQTQRFYDNHTYAGHHQLVREEVRDAAYPGGPKLFRATVNTYEARPLFAAGSTSDATFSALIRQKTSFYEATTNDPAAAVKSTTIEHDYDATGNPIRMSDYGDDDPAVGIDDLHFAITYQTATEPVTGALFPRPNNVYACSIKPTFPQPQPIPPQPPCPVANTLRHRSAVWGAHGEMLTMSDDHFGGKDPATGSPYLINQAPSLGSAFTYDTFGNVQTATDPTGYGLTYTYDSDTNSHIAKITDSFGYKSSHVYDSRFGSLLDTTDVNGYREHFDSDLFGRQITIIAPQDIGSILPTDTADHRATATVAISYAIPSQSQPFGNPQPVFWALTKNKDASHATDTIDTVVLVDGLGRVRQVKKDATVGTDGRILSGRVTFDQVGRAYQEGFPTFEQASNSAQTAYVQWPNMPFARTNSYDVLDRVRAIQTPDDKGKTVAPDGAKTVTTLFSFDPKVLDNTGMQLTRTVTDAQGKVQTQYVSPRGEILAVSQLARVGTAFPNGTPTVLTTHYSYDRLSELTQVQDAAANVTTAGYDSLGQVVLLQSPDAGQTEWRFDTSGRLAAKETANLRSKNLLIKYTYDVNRVKTIVYPPSSAYPNATAQVTYTYGQSDQVGASFGNVAGRISMVQDESGTETRKYDTLGNVSHTEKTPMTLAPSIPGVTYKMDYVYDQLGRVQSITYPDGETITYGYDAGGLVNGITGKRLNGTQTTYVSSLIRNQDGQRVSMTLGNGWNTHNFYLTDNHRLQATITTLGSAQIQNIGYGYDLVGNLTNVTNNVPTPTPVTPNTVIAPGPTFQNFVYDDLYQLASASGTYTGCACGCGNTRNYTLTMQYDGIGNINVKNQTDVIVSPSGVTQQAATNYNNGYTYGAQQSFGQKAGPHAPTGVGPETVSYDRDGNQTVYSGNFGPSRSLTWTEDDRLRTETDSGFTNTFLYDAAGNRTHKRRTTLETWYVNPVYVVKNSLTESKHIMIGDERVATAVATITNRQDPTTAGANTLFYYHSDKVHNTSYVTGGDGSILQHDEYFPSGEVWFQEQKNNDARNTQPYLFNAKELDETGLYAFGGRYYNPKFSTWTSADPILGSYMQRGPTGASPRNLGLYSYSWNNPVTLRDPDGLQTPNAGGYEPMTGRPPFMPGEVGGEFPAEPMPIAIRIGGPAGATAMAARAVRVPVVGLFVAAFLVGLALGMASNMHAPGADDQPVTLPPTTPAGPMSAPTLNPDTVMSLPGPTSHTNVKAPGAPDTGTMTVTPRSPDLPILDKSGKVHTGPGGLPNARDLTLDRYDRSELTRFRDDLKTSVQTRIDMNAALGPKGNHGRRQNEEQRLIKRLDRVLDQK
jgi:RHS repeat-associated protein